MSLSNLTSELKKSWMNINVNSIGGVSGTFDPMITSLININNVVNVNAQYFHLGNIVFAEIRFGCDIINTTPASGIEFAITNLPVPKTSNFTGRHDASGVASIQTGGVDITSDSAGPTIKFNTVSGIVFGSLGTKNLDVLLGKPPAIANQGCSVFFSYSTD